MSRDTQERPELPNDWRQNVPHSLRVAHDSAQDILKQWKYLHWSITSGKSRHAIKYVCGFMEKSRSCHAAVSPIADEFIAVADRPAVWGVEYAESCYHTLVGALAGKWGRSVAEELDELLPVNDPHSGDSTPRTFSGGDIKEFLQFLDQGTALGSPEFVEKIIAEFDRCQSSADGNLNMRSKFVDDLLLTTFICPSDARRNSEYGLFSTFEESDWSRIWGDAFQCLGGETTEVLAYSIHQMNELGCRLEQELCRACDRRLVTGRRYAGDDKPVDIRDTYLLNVSRNLSHNNRIIFDFILENNHTVTVDALYQHVYENEARTPDALRKAVQRLNETLSEQFKGRCQVDWSPPHVRLKTFD